MDMTPMIAPDFIKTHGAVIEELSGKYAVGTTLRMPDTWVYRFPGLTYEQVRNEVNQAMDFAIPHFRNNVFRSGVQIDEQVIEEVALRIALSVVSNRNGYPRGFWFF